MRTRALRAGVPLVVFNAGTEGEFATAFRGVRPALQQPRCSPALMSLSKIAPGLIGTFSFHATRPLMKVKLTKSRHHRTSQFDPKQLSRLSASLFANGSGAHLRSAGGASVHDLDLERRATFTDKYET
jgi:hypothetical protein